MCTDGLFFAFQIHQFKFYIYKYSTIFFFVDFVVVRNTNRNRNSHRHTLPCHVSCNGGVTKLNSTFRMDKIYYYHIPWVIACVTNRWNIWINNRATCSTSDCGLLRCAIRLDDRFSAHVQNVRVWRCNDLITNKIEHLAIFPTAGYCAICHVQPKCRVYVVRASSINKNRLFSLTHVARETNGKIRP